MTAYGNLSVLARGLFSVWAAALVLLSSYVCFFSILRKRYHTVLYAAVLFLVNYLILQNCAHVNVCRKKGIVPEGRLHVISGCPWLVAVFIACVMTILCVTALIRLERWLNSNVTENSIKEGMDNLPSGLCWYNRDGVVIMKNNTMERICATLTGRYLYNGINLLEALRSRMAENNVLFMPDDTVWSIYLGTVKNGNETLHEICAYDITDEYKTTRQLTEKQKEARIVNEKLTQYNRELAQMITAEEVLAAKVRIHDELGQALLLARKYLLRGGTESDREKLLDELLKTGRLMENTQREKGSSYLEMIMEAAEDMGVHLVISGNLPESDPIRNVVMTAMHENLTNTIRHAQGDEMRVTLTDEQGLYTAVITNNGNTPKEPVEERGGLAMLRMLTENTGGVMKIENEPEFRMTIRFTNGGQATEGRTV